MELYGSIQSISGSMTASVFTGSFVGDGSGLYGISATGVTGLNLSQISTGSVTASVSPNGFNVNSDTSITGSLVVAGSIIAEQYDVTFISSSVLFQSGSTKFGDTQDDTHTVTGALNVTGSISLNGQSFDNVVKAKLNTENVVSGAIQISITGLTDYSTFSTSISQSISRSLLDSKNYTDEKIALLDFATPLTALNQATASLNSFTSSIDTTIKNKLNADGVISGSIQVDITQTTSYTQFSSSIATTDLNQSNKISAIESTTSSLNSFTSSINTTIKNKLNADGVVSSSAQIDITGTTGYSTFSGSIATTNLSQDNRLNSLETTSGSLNTFSSSALSRLTSIESTTSSLNTFSSSANSRLNSLESASGSIRSDFNTYTSSNNTTNTTQNSRLNSIESTTSSLNTFTSSTNTRLSTIEATTSSLNGFTSSINTTIKNKLNADGVISGSVQVDITQTTNYTSFSSSLATTDLNQTNKISTIETTTGSLNSFTSSANTRLNALENTSASINSYTSSNTTNINAIHTATSSLNSYTSSTNTRLGVIETTTGSLNSYTSSANTRFNSIETSTASLNSFTSSANTRLNSIETSTGSLNNFTSSQNTINSAYNTATASLNSFTSSTNTRLGVIESTTSSLNSYTSSNNTRLGVIESTTASLNSFTSSANTRLNSIETSTGSLNSYTSSANTRFNSIETSTGSLNSYTSSNNTRLTQIETSTASLNLYTSSTNTRLGVIETSTASLNSFTSSINTTIKNRLNAENVVSGSAQITITSTNGYSTFSSSLATTDAGQDSRLNSLEGKTGSYATTGSNIFIGDQTITGSLYVSQNLVIAGSSSIQHISSSVVNIADNIITVNAQNPGIRFGGLAVIDSGSAPQVSGSILFDSVNNQWIFVHQNQSTVTSSVLLMGPETYNNLGGETYITANRLVKSTGIEHLSDSNITDTGTKVSINSNTEITGSLIVTGTVGGTNITAIQTATSSLNSYTSSNTSNINAIHTSTASLNTYTSSNTTNINSIHTATSSLNTFTSSANGRLTSIESATSSLNTYTSSTNTFISNTNGRLTSIESATSSLNSYTSSTNTRLGVIETSTASLNSFTSSTSTRLGLIETSTGSLNTFTSSANTRLTLIETSTSSLNSFTGSINTTIKNRLNAENVLSSSAQVVAALPSGTVSGSSQILVGTTIHSGAFFNGITVVSGSQQIDHNATTNYEANRHIDHTTVSVSAGSGLSGGGTIAATRTITLDTGSVHFLDGVKKELNTEGVLSGSAQVTFGSISGIPSGLVSGSAQITFGSISGIPSGLVSGSAQVSFGSISGVPSGLVSGSAQITFGSISGLPSGLVSGSSQIAIASTSGFSTYLDQAVKSGSTVTFGGLTVNNASVIANNTSINPSGYTNSVVAGAVGTGGWGITSGLGGNAGTNMNWGMGHNGSKFYFGLSNGSNALATWMEVHPNKTITLNGYTTNGFVKFTNADGTLAVDTNSYQTVGSTFFVGTTSIANNRASGAQTLTGVSIDGNAATATSATTAGTATNSTQLNGITETQIFNNMGANHSARTSFDASTASYGFGFRYVQGNTNGPATGGGGQFYSWYLGLGNDYPATGSGSYGMYVAIPRTATTPYMSVRYNENNSLGSWIKIAAGYADTAGSANSVAGSNVSGNISGNAANITAYTINQNLGTGNSPTFQQIYSGYNTASGRANLSFAVSSGVLGNIHIQNGAGSGSGSANQAAITFMGSASNASQAGIYVLNDNSNGTSMGFATTDSYGIGPQLFMTATNNGIVNFPRANPTSQGNAILHAGNYTSYTLPRGGSWYGVNTPGSRWGGFSVSGGEIVFGDGLPNAGQMGILIDGAYLAGENNGFWSLPSNNDWNGRVGFYRDGSGNAAFNSSVIPTANNAYNLGTASLGWANVYTNDLHLSNMNKEGGNDIDGTNGNWTIQEGAENLYIINNNNGKKYKIKLEEI